MDFHDRHFDGIQALRGIAAFFVVLEHIGFLNCGAFGVDIFFCISGFMIMFSTHRSREHFLAKRLIRILPFYYFMTLLSFLLLQFFPDMFIRTEMNPVFLAKSLTFIPFDIGDGVLQPLLRIGWTVNCEVFFYLLFALSMRISQKYRGVACSFFLILFVSLAGLLPTGFSPLVFYGNPVMLEFILGILAYYLCRRIYLLHSRRKFGSPLFFLSAFIAFSCLLALTATKHSINILGFRRPLFWGIPALVIVLCFFTMGLCRSMPVPLVKLGNISFSLYLVHYYPIMFLDRMIFHFERFSPSALLGAIVGIMICISLALPAHWLFERKLSGFLKTRLLSGSAQGRLPKN